MKIFKSKINLILVCVALAVISILSVCAFDFLYTPKYKIDKTDNVEPLASAVINSPTIHEGTMKFYSAASSNATTKKYSGLTTSVDSSAIKAKMTQTYDNTLTMSTTASNKNSKNAYFDFFTCITIPALTEYKVTYTLTYTIKKVASNGSASAYAKLYNYGDIILSNGDYRCAESLYNMGTDLEFNISNADTKNEYWVGNIISTSAYNSVAKKTYSWEHTYTNENETAVTHRNYYGYYGFIAYATGYASRMQSTVAITADITPRLLATPRPTDVNVQYTGQSLSLADIVSEQKTWYDAEIMDLDYSENQDMVNVGTKRIKATIKSEVRNDDNKFSGEIGEGEEEYVRYFNFVIEKKKIGLDVGLNVNGQPTWQIKSGAVYGGDTAENGRAPDIAFNYSSIDGKGYNSSEYPADVGKYKATARIINDCSYELDNKYEVEFDVDKKDVVKPDISGQRSVVYNGSDIDFFVSNVTDDVVITPSEGMTYQDGKFTAKYVGNYVATISLKDHGNSTRWANSNGDTAQYTLEFEITQAVLTLSTACSASDWIWQVGDNVEVSIIEDSFADDVTELRVFYKDYRDYEYDYINGEEFKKVDGKKRIVTMPTDMPIGNYTLHIELYGNRADNANYKLSQLSVPFTILGNDIEFNERALRWRYNGILVDDPTQILELTYIDSIYRFDIDVSNLQDMGVRIDTEKGINGFEGDITAKDVNDGSIYSVKVNIVNFDSSYQEYGASFSLAYRIGKAKFDLTDLKWEYSEPLPYKTNPQSVILTGTLPKGLTATYSGNGQIPVGAYTTNVTFHVADVGNYFIPSKVDSETYIYDEGEFPFSVDWNIVKATLTCNWISGQDLGSGIYKLPIVSASAGFNLDTMVTYKYYDGEGSEINLADIDVNKENSYLAVAALTESYAENYKLANEEFSFTIGRNRYPVRLSADIADMLLPYKDSPYELHISIDESRGGVTLPNVELKYYAYDSGEELSEAPSSVGKYRVEASLTFELAEHNYIENDIFEFEIVKADLDLSQLQWQYTHTDIDGNQIILIYDFEQLKWLNPDGTEAKSFVYDGAAHNVELLGKDDVNGLVVNYLNEDGDYINELSFINADDFDVFLEFVYDEDNYNFPGFSDMLTLVVEQAELDVSRVVWGYTDENGEDKPYTEAFVFTRKDGQDVEFTLKLINLPDELKDAVIYSGSTSASNAGLYTVNYTLDFNDSNYADIEMDSLLSNRRWEIKQRIIAKLTNNGSWTEFDGKEHSFAEIFGITEDGWENYVNIFATYNEESFDGYTATNAGAYILSFTLIDAGDNNANLNWAERPALANLVEISGIKLNISQWSDEGVNSRAVLENEIFAWYLEYKYFNADGEEISLDRMLPNVEYFKEVRVQEKYAVNLEISYGSMIRIPFSWSDGKTMAHKPTFERLEITFDSNTHTIEDFGMSETEDFIQVDLPNEMKNAGEYIVRFKFKYSGLYCWEDGTDGVYEVTLKILKAHLPPEWNYDGETPTFVVPNGFFGLVDVQYYYYDSDGNEIAFDDLKSGESYKVVARLDEQHANNFEFVDAEGEVLPNAYQSEEKTFEKNDGSKKPIDSGDNDGKGIALEELLAKLKEVPFWQMMISGIGIIFVLIFLSKAISYDSKRRKTKKIMQNKYANYYAIAVLGLSAHNWTITACIICALALVSFVVMMLTKARYIRYQEKFDSAKDVFEQEQTKKKEEDMRMMLMGAIGSNAGGSNGVQPAAVDMGEIRSMIDDAMARNIRQVPESTANFDNDLVQKLLEENAKNQESLQNLMRKLSEQQPTEKIIEREVAASNANDETVKHLLEKSKNDDEKIEKLIKNQEQLIEKISAMSSERIVEKVVEKPVEKIVEVPIERVVEKEVRVEVPVEKVVEKVVEKEVKAKAEAKPKKQAAPRLTLEEAYAKLNKTQKRFFDELRAYAMSKDSKCKEKLSTYFTTIGPSSVNPLIKLTIKKNTTVAMFKLEDEYTKDIRRNAANEGSKIKVKETELIVSDEQAFDTAKEMTDLRVDQIDRYNDYLKEQRAMKRK